MTDSKEAARGRVRARRILIHGLALILTGLVWGIIIPFTPFPRLALTAHIEFEVNGLLVVALATLLLTLPHNVGPRSLRVISVTVWIVWAMMATEVANAWWGTNQTLPIAASQAGATGGAPWQETIVKLAHVIGAVGLITTLLLMVIGFVASPRRDDGTAQS